ncbi:MAG: ABC transporter substrate-binding protein, partial [Acidimicrobiales bacterium]
MTDPLEPSAGDLHPEAAGQARHDRRRFLADLGRGATALGLGAVLAPRGSLLQALSLPTSRPRRGGTLTVGLTGGATTDTLNPLNPLLNTDFARIYQLFDPLVAFTSDAGFEMRLAEEVAPNRQATSWVVRLKKGITFHNGKDLTADDVIYTFQQIKNPKNVYGGATYIGAVDVAGIKRLDRYTVSVPCAAPFSTFDQVLPCYYFSIIPVDFDVRNPVGTGPFKFESFTPGQTSTFIRNNDYFMAGLPYLDRVVINNFADEVSQLNSLESGTSNAIGLLSSASVSSARSAGQVVVSKGGGWTPFTMRVDKAPFHDPRVRQAFRYAIDRKQMLKLVFDGYGTIGNDLFAIWDRAYDHAIPQRQHDPDRARYLLKKAGHSRLSTTLVTSAIAEGTVSAATVLAQQVKSAGIDVSLRPVTPTVFYGPNYLKWTFAQDYWYYNPYMPQVAGAMLPSSPANETHFDGTNYNRLYREALATVNEV